MNMHAYNSCSTGYTQPCILLSLHAHDICIHVVSAGACARSHTRTHTKQGARDSVTHLRSTHARERSQTRHTRPSRVPTHSRWDHCLGLSHAPLHSVCIAFQSGYACVAWPGGSGGEFLPGSESQDRECEGFSARGEHKSSGCFPARKFAGRATRGKYGGRRTRNELGGKDSDSGR